MRRLLSGISSKSAIAGRTILNNLAATYSRADLIPVGLTILVMLLLKRHYSLATAGQLDWILGPTARLVSWSTSANLVPEIGVGHVDFARGIIVAPGCAGVNFMIMAFGLTAFYGLYCIRRLPGQLAWLLLALAAAYGLTLIVNTMRIVMSMTLFNANIYTGWLTVARVHRLAGVGLYFTALWILSRFTAGGDNLSQTLCPSRTTYRLAPIGLVGLDFVSARRSCGAVGKSGVAERFSCIWRALHHCSRRLYWSVDFNRSDKTTVDERCKNIFLR